MHNLMLQQLAADRVAELRADAQQVRHQRVRRAQRDVEAGPSRAAVITYVNPLVAVVLGVLVLDERLGAMSLVGLLAILGGSWLATRGRRLRRRSPAEAGT